MVRIETLSAEAASRFVMRSLICFSWEVSMRASWSRRTVAVKDASSTGFWRNPVYWLDLYWIACDMDPERSLAASVLAGVWRLSASQSA
jgi:hypothetical protein